MPGFKIPNVISCTSRPSTYDGPDIDVEFARTNRWLFEVLPPFGTIKDGILLYAHKCTRPTPEIDQIVIHHGQDEIYRPGKNRWSPIDITFYEKTKSLSDIPKLVDEAAERVYKWWSESVLVLRESRHGKQEGFPNGILKMLDGYGNTIWEYNLYQCWPTKVTPSDLDYADGNIAEITVTIRFNKAKECREDCR